MFFRIGFLLFAAALLASANGRVLTREENDVVLRATLVNPARIFEKWTQENGVTYTKGTQEFENRYQIWRSNLQWIAEANKESRSYWLGLNQFTDLTFEEFAKTYLRDEPIIDNRFIEQFDAAAEPNENEARLPKAVDWRDSIPRFRTAARAPLGTPSLLSALSKAPAYVTINFARDLQFYTGGVFDGACNRDFVKHRILAVGYNKESRIPFITLKTRLGRIFGEAGFLRISANAEERTEGQCGVAQDIIIPVTTSRSELTRNNILPTIPVETGAVRDVYIPRFPIRSTLTRDSILPTIPFEGREARDVYIPKLPIRSTQTGDSIMPTIPFEGREVRDVYIPKLPIRSSLRRDNISPTIPFEGREVRDVYIPIGRVAWG